MASPGFRWIDVSVACVYQTEIKTGINPCGRLSTEFGKVESQRKHLAEDKNWTSFKGMKLAIKNITESALAIKLH